MADEVTPFLFEPLSCRYKKSRRARAGGKTEDMQRLKPYRPAKHYSATGRDREVDGSGNIIGDRGITKAYARRSGSTGIFQEWIDAGIVGMVENIDEAGAEFKRCAFAQLDSFTQRDVRDVADGILRNVAWNIAEGRAKNGLGGSAVNDEPHLIVLNYCRVPTVGSDP